MESSILVSIKKLLGITEEYTNFDEDIILQINSAFSTLNQLGVGPVEGFSIEGPSAVWSDFINDYRLNFAKTFVQLKVKLAFDPPTSGTLMDSYNRQLDELTWRLSIVNDEGESEDIHKKIIARIPSSATVNATGKTTFKNDEDKELFSSQMPIYSGDNN
ncbi:MAG: hypothetical protein IIZ78_26405 [Clostridiales bacterium]|nr:hypothetical protein [Clostridiales bacterium]